MGYNKNVQLESSRTRPCTRVLLWESHQSTSQTQTTSTWVCECWTNIYMDDRRTHSIYSLWKTRAKEQMDQLLAFHWSGNCWQKYSQKQCSVATNYYQTNRRDVELQRNKRPTSNRQRYPEKFQKKTYIYTDLSMTWKIIGKHMTWCPIHGFWNVLVQMVGVAQNKITLWRTDSVDIKSGGTWDSIHQKRNLSRRLAIAITVCDHWYCHWFKKEGCKFNHQLFMDVFKLYCMERTVIR